MTQEYKNFIQILTDNNIRPVEFANYDYDEELFENYKILETSEAELHESSIIYKITNLINSEVFYLKAINVDSNPAYPDLGYSFDEYKEVVKKEETRVVTFWEEV